MNDAAAGYLDDIKARPGDNALTQLNALAERQAKEEAEVARLLAELEKAQEALKKTSEQDLPTLMDELGLADFRTTTGLRIEVSEEIRCGIPKANADAAFAWLDKNGFGRLVKRVISVPFAKGEEKKATAFKRKLKGLEYDDKKSVHHSTLKAFVVERLKSGEEIPSDLFGIHRQRVSKIER
jgi:hypothetical protein